jgi:fatty acid desaturase
MLLENTELMEGIPRELLQPAEPRRLAFRAIEDWAIYAAICGLALVASPWLYPLWLLLLAGRLHALGVVLHDVVHMPRRAKTPSVRLIELLAGYPIGSTVEAMRYHHLRHHRDLGLSADPYLKRWVGRSRLRFWIMSLRYFLLAPLWIVRGVLGVFATYIPALRNIYGRLFLQDHSGEDLTTSSEVLECAREDRWQTVFYLGIVGLTLLFPRAMLRCYLAPLVVAGYLAGYRLLMEHVQEANADRSAEATIRSTRNHHLGWGGALLFAPHNVGYHLVHHLHPQAALENLPGLQRWYEGSGKLSPGRPY